MSAAANIECPRELTDDEQEAIGSILREHNRTASPQFWATLDTPQGQRVPLYLVARDHQRQIIGGLWGHTQLAWLKVEVMAVAEHQRGKGVGRELLQSAEKEGLARGCRYAFLDTLEHQGPEFYQRCGYEIAGRIDDWDSHGHTKFYFTKRLFEHE